MLVQRSCRSHRYSTDDGQTIVVGSPFNDGGGEDAGHVRVFEWDSSGWAQVGGDIEGDQRRGNFGRSVAISANGETVIAGAPLANDSAGDARVFRWDGASWTQLGPNLVDEESLRDDISNFGSSVAISAEGDLAVVGVPFENDEIGAARVYLWDGQIWDQISQIDGELPLQQFGWSVAVSGSGETVIVGSPNDGDGFAGNVGVFPTDNSS